MNKSAVFAELRKRGITKVVVGFSGGGDEGGVDDISLFNAEGKVGTLQESYAGETYDPATKKWIPARTLTEDEKLATALGKPVYDKYCTFAGEFHVHGEVVWDVAKGTVNMQGSQSVERYDDFEEEI